MTSYKIGALAERSGCLVETVRYYERIGLLPAPVRSANNYRAYSEDHVDRLLFIRNCRALDMSIDEIRMLIEIRDRPDSNCAEVNDLVDSHIAHITERIAALRALESQLRDLRSCCNTERASSDCGILHALLDLGSDATVPVPRH